MYEGVITPRILVSFFFLFPTYSIQDFLGLSVIGPWSGNKFSDSSFHVDYYCPWDSSPTLCAFMHGISLLPTEEAGRHGREDFRGGSSSIIVSYAMPLSWNTTGLKNTSRSIDGGVERFPLLSTGVGNNCN